MAMWHAIPIFLAFAVSAFAHSDLHRATLPALNGLDKRLTIPQTCQFYAMPGVGACQVAAQQCGWSDSTVLCYQISYDYFQCYDPAQGFTCCADETVASPGESCNGAAIASGTWLYTISAAYAEPSSGDSYAPFSSSSPSDNSYSSYGSNPYSSYPTPESSSQGYGPISTGPPSWPSPTRTFYGGSPSSSVVGLSAGATTCPRLGLDVAGVALAAVGAFLI